MKYIHAFSFKECMLKLSAVLVLARLQIVDTKQKIQLQNDLLKFNWIIKILNHYHLRGNVIFLYNSTTTSSLVLDLTEENMVP